MKHEEFIKKIIAQNKQKFKCNQIFNLTNGIKQKRPKNFTNVLLQCEINQINIFLLFYFFYLEQNSQLVM